MSAYRSRYFDFLRAVQSTRAISLVASEALKDFPAGLPAKSRKNVVAFMRDVGGALTSVLEQKKNAPDEIAGGVEARKTVTVKQRGTLATVAVQLFMTQTLSGRNPRDLDFPYRLRAQELVMLLAHFDAFMSDSLRAICLREPNTLKRSKTLAWEDIIRSGSWEALMRRLVDDHVYAFGWGSAREKLTALERECGLKIEANEPDLVKIDEAEQIRHLVVHNNCRVSHEYIRRTRRTTPRIGKSVQIPPRLVEETASAVTVVASSIFTATAAKFFGADPTTLTGVWRRRGMPGHVTSTDV